ncbi:Down syndrome cell adhesion molecule-like protein Dscam2 isoform X6 [Oopsacas minuta]|uniref:Down syndrome cell adhesion molecule-like protein Dscam2 isoform X6 n=1 Tax=Oopsacas minuta TaxID=111878 RepID=A0AAV7JUA5_9METZ|nr:Down syndrome cell adhesion molecule-like protein Dscam2 isoform X6 [Oopsacas minuta]
MQFYNFLELPVFPNFFAPFQGTEGKLYTITLDYSGTCEPLTKIDLLKGSESVENDSNIQLEITDTSVIISFSTLTLSDQASYTLTSENKAGIATTSVGLIVKHKPIFLEKNVFPGSLLLANSTATLSCNYTGYPMVTITWYDPDGVEITEGITTESIGRWKYSELELKRLSQSDAGSYTCSASNQVGSTINTINIQVTSPMSIPWVSDIGSNQVRVSWDEPSEDYMINKYRVDYKKAANGISMWLAGGEVLVGTQQTTINNLQGNTYYMVRIVYFASVGQFYGSPIQFKTLHRAPTNSPDNLQGITISNSILEYNWNKPAQAYSDGDSIIISYRLWWTSTEENYESVLVDGTITRYTLMGLLASTKYSVKVQAYTEGGFGPNSTIIEVVTYADTFEFPSLLLTKKMVDLSWIIEWALEEEPNVEIQYYIILLRYSGEIFYEIGPLSSNITSYNFSNLDGTKYSKVCIEVEASGILQSRNCTELYVTNENRSKLK